MFLLDRLLISGLGFVFDKVATAVNSEMDDEERLRGELMDAGMQLESGELTEEDYEELEAVLLARLRELKEQREGPADGNLRVTGVEATFGGDED